MPLQKIDTVFNLHVMEEADRTRNIQNTAYKYDFNLSNFLRWYQNNVEIEILAEFRFESILFKKVKNYQVPK